MLGVWPSALSSCRFADGLENIELAESIVPDVANLDDGRGAKHLQRNRIPEEYGLQLRLIISLE